MMVGYAGGGGSLCWFIEILRQRLLSLCFFQTVVLIFLAFYSDSLGIVHFLVKNIWTPTL